MPIQVMPRPLLWLVCGHLPLIILTAQASTRADAVSQALVFGVEIIFVWGEEI